MKCFVHEIPKPSKNPPMGIHYDVVVVGGGMSGLCAAIASARHGANTALIQDRSCFGGNASSETKMHISGASCHWGKKNAAETGILMELQLENKRLNDNYNFSVWDGVLWAKAKSTKNLTVYMNTTMDVVNSDGTKISSIICYQMTTEMSFAFTAGIFIDSTGNGTLGYFAGDEYCIGREDAKTYNEKDAPPQCDGQTMGNTLYFCARDTGHPVKFVKPDWAYSFDESDFKHRYHGDITVYHDANDVVVLPKNCSYESFASELVEKYDVMSGYWWIELGGDWDDIIKQSEDIRWELYKTIYGVWDHIKNGGEHGAENYELIWVGNVAGMRESRRLMGTYVLTEEDILSNNERQDAVAYGGWPMDEHTAGGFRAKGQIPSKVRSFKGFYGIPYGCFCARNISNLMMTGRAISASKLAMGSTRVMGTCAVGGQAAGTAAALAVQTGLDPVRFGKEHIQELRQALLKDDCYLLGCKNEDPDDYARTALVTASSQKPGYEAAHVVDGVARSVGEESHLWMSDGFSSQGEWLQLALRKEVPVQEVRLTFDPNLSEERCISISKAFLDKEPLGVAKELVKDYTVELFFRGTCVWKREMQGNYQRHCVLEVPSVAADTVKISITATNGVPEARVFEVRVY